jgi:hypothetical protein
VNTTHKAGPESGSKAKVLAIVAAVVALLLLATTVTLGVLYSGAQGEIETLSAEKSELETGLSAATSRVQEAESEARAWEGVADNWRLCGIALLETVDSLVNDDIYGGLANIGAARGKCESARNSEDAVGGTGV